MRTDIRKNSVSQTEEKQRTLRGFATALEEFTYPDGETGRLPQALRVVAPKNGKPGVQVVIETTGKTAEVSLVRVDGGEKSPGDEGGFCAEWYEMKPIPVEYNTGDGVEQGGAMVLEKRPEHTPSYVTRKAPFYVYDCLSLCAVTQMEADGEGPECKEASAAVRMPASGGRAAFYLCLVPKTGITAGDYTFLLRVCAEEGVWECALTASFYDVEIPEDTFPVTNWFSQQAICRFHEVREGTPEYLDMLRLYIKAMRRMHQNIFFIQLDGRCIVSKEPWVFDFEYLTPVIDCFFSEGMRTLELGVLLHRGFLADGTTDMYTERFTCALMPELAFDSLEGYVHTVRFVQSLSEYLRRHGWEKQVLFHIHDEPDIHYRDEAALEKRRRQYYLAAGILRKYLPDVRIIEAVASAAFYGGVDIWVPGTAGYESERQEFDTLIALGETVWSYVCCSPEGEWLNRFLDFHLLRGRLLFWGFAKNRISGFLHWGFNQFPYGMDPFQGTSCPNDTGIGTNFPCGDSFLVYPQQNGPAISMRLEAARRGAEDAALWQLLRQKEEALHDRLISEIFVNNYTYCKEPEKFAQVYERLLKELETAGVFLVDAK